ncbi:hypothetical protein C8R47DRAFT_1329558 [Mycena vitilis]|nr:hypothetical protein C8R47DRAFT_1329558 [Mycena vitilis]
MSAVASPAYILRLPPEVTCEIFHEVCTLPFDVPAILRCKVYNDRCTRIRHTHPHWWTIVSNCAVFWTKIYIDCSTSPEQILYHLSFAGDSLPLHVTLNFDLYPVTYRDIDAAPDCPPSSLVPWGEVSAPDYNQSWDDYAFDHPPTWVFDAERPDDGSSSSSYSGDGVDSPTAYCDYMLHGIAVRDCLLAVCPSVSRWRDVSIRTPTDYFLAALLDVLGTIPGPDIRSLSFECPWEDDDPRSCVPLLSESRPLFDASLPLLFNVQLTSASVPYAIPYFGALRSLSIRDLPADLWPSVGDFVVALTASPLLEELVVGGGGVDFPHDSPPVRAFTLPSLRTLRVFADEFTTSVLRLLLSAACPLLRTLHFSELGVADWSAMSSNEALPFMENVTVSGWAAASIQVQVFLLRSRSVIHLDVRLDNPGKVSVLLALNCTTIWNCRLPSYISTLFAFSVGPRTSFVNLVGQVIDHERISIERAVGIRLSDVDWKGYNKKSGMYKEPNDKEDAPCRTKIRGQYLRKIKAKKTGRLAP